MKSIAPLKLSLTASPVSTHQLCHNQTSGLPWLLPPPAQVGISDLSAQELYLTMLSMAAMMKNIRIGSRRMYWDRVRHPVSEK